MNAFVRQWGGRFANHIPVTYSLSNVKVPVPLNFEGISVLKERKVGPGIKFAIGVREKSLRNYETYHFVAINPIVLRLVNWRHFIVGAPLFYANSMLFIELLDPQYVGYAPGFGIYFTIRAVSRLNGVFLKLVRNRLDGDYMNMWRLYVNSSDFH